MCFMSLNKVCLCNVRRISSLTAPFSTLRLSATNISRSATATHKRIYNNLWAGAQEELRRLLTAEGRVVSFQHLAMLYVRYIQIFRQLEEAYDHMVHPQRRRVIRLILDCVIGRVLELKNEMVREQFSEYHYMNDVLRDLKLTPTELEIPVPRYFIRACSKEVQERKLMLTNIFKMVEIIESPKPSQPAHELSQEKVNVVERAHQGKQNEESLNMERTHSAKKIESAVIYIQKVWRGYTERKRTKMARDAEMIFLGMALDPKYLVPRPAEITAQANEAFTWIKQQSYEEDFQSAIVSVTNQLRDVEGPDMKENMKDQIRQWFMECCDGEGSFPDYPDEEDGGSALIFAEKNPQELAKEIAAKGGRASTIKPTGKEAKIGKQVKGKDTHKDGGLKMLPSAFLSDLEVGHNVFVDIWQNGSESTNLSQKHEVELIKEEKTKVIKAEIQLQMDEEMRQELTNLKELVNQVKGGKAKGSVKKKSAKGEHKEKDLTAHRTLESLCQELVEQGLLKRVNDVRLQDYLGDYNYRATTLIQNDIPMPSWSDVRQVLALYAILPLGSQVVHEKAPLIKAILLAGPGGVGKKMLVHAICQETGATLFDLSPLNTAGKYPGRSGLNMMLHIVFKVARLMQPSVIWVGEAEKMFNKRAPDEGDELDPNRLKEIFPKFLKMIKGKDRVLVMGTTKDPLSAVIKSLCKVFSKIVLILSPDYGSRYVLWKGLIKKHGGEVTSVLDLGFLATISDGYTQGHMVEVIQSILTEHRILQQAKRPLTAAEFVAPFDSFDPVFKEEEVLKKWYAKTPLAKKRVKAAIVMGGKEASVKSQKN